jgi:hypothetical protein
VNLDQHRRTQDRAITATVTAVCGLGLAGALSPVVEHGVTAALLMLSALVVVVATARWLGLRLRERREDRADILAGATWRAQHMPHLAARLGERVQAGVA